MADSTALGTGLAGVISSLVGVGAYLTNRRSKRIADHLRQSDEKALLVKTEVEAWKNLIETLNLQYKSATEEIGGLRKRLSEGNKRFEEMTMMLQEATFEHRRLIHLEEELAVARERIAVLEAELTRIKARSNQQGEQ